MSFAPSEREALLAVKGVGPTVVARLEQMGFDTLARLSRADALEIVSTAASLAGSSCWKNSPQARAAIQGAIALARTMSAQAWIRDVSPADLSTVAMLVSESNKDVAARFGLHAGNAPKHPSFCTAGWVEADIARGETYFILDDPSAGPVGCVAYDSPAPGRAYLNRLSVLPDHRERGAGARLVQHVVAHARGHGVTSISIGVIGEYPELQRWYHKLGFVDGETRHFAHLPFSVKYMTLAL